MARTAIVGVLNCRLNALLLADPADSLVVYFHMLVMPQIIRNSAVPFIWMVCMYLLHQFCNVLVFCCTLTLPAV